MTFPQNQKPHRRNIEPRTRALRALIGKKNGKDKPEIMRQFGKEDKLIKDYLEIYDQFKDF